MQQQKLFVHGTEYYQVKQTSYLRLVNNLLALSTEIRLYQALQL